MEGRIFTVSQRQEAAICELIEQCDKLPWPGIRQVSDELRRSVVLDNIQPLLDRPGAIAFAVGDESRLQGFVLATLLDWDTQQLGKRCARIEHLHAGGAYSQRRVSFERLLGAAMQWLEDHEVEMVHVRLPLRERAAIHTLEAVGFRFMTCLSYIYRRPVNQTTPLTRSLDRLFSVRAGHPSDLREMQEISRHAFGENRYGLDPNLDVDLVNRLYAAWLSNAVQDVHSRFLVCERHGKLVSFLGYQLQRYERGSERFRVGRISLLASAADEQSQGSPLALVRRCMRDLQNQVDTIEAVIGSWNDAALRPMDRFGFRCLDTVMDLHAWL